MKKFVLFLFVPALLLGCKKNTKIIEEPTPTNFVGNISITTAAQLEIANGYGDRLSEIIGTVFIDMAAGNLDASALSEVTSRFRTIDGDLTIRANASINLSGLTRVSGRYTLLDNEVNH